jgi:hypothetical protein
MNNILPPWRDRLISKQQFLTDAEWDSVVDYYYMSITQSQHLTEVTSNLNNETVRSSLSSVQTILNSFQDIINSSLRSKYINNYQAVLLAYEAMNGCKTTFKNVNVGTCCFSGENSNLIQSRVYRANGSLSQPFVYHERFVNMVKCWALLGRVKDYITEVIRHYAQNNTDHTIERCKQDKLVQSLKHNLNSAAKYLFMFFFG